MNKIPPTLPVYIILSYAESEYWDIAGLIRISLTGEDRDNTSYGSKILSTNNIVCNGMLLYIIKMQEFKLDSTNTKKIMIALLLSIF